MSSLLTGKFLTTNNHQITIEITSPHGQELIEIPSNEIQFAADPCTIECDNDSLMNHIIYHRCTIRLQTSRWLGDLLFAANQRQCRVRVYRDADCVFSGYVEPQTFNQSWAQRTEEIEILCIDELSCLQYEKMTQHTSWAQLRSENNILSFVDILSRILPTNTWWDNSRLINGDPMLTRCGIPMQLLLGDAVDDLWSNEEICLEILKYCNLHIIELGDKILIFDWDTIGSSNTVTFTNLYDNTTITVDCSALTVTTQMFDSDDTQLSISKAYNQLRLRADQKCEDEVLQSPMNTDDTHRYVVEPQLFMSEYHATDSKIFKDIVQQGYSHPNTIVNGNRDWKRTDWYFTWNYNTNYTLRYHGRDIAEWLERDGVNGYINMHRVLQTMKRTRFFPALISVGRNDAQLSYQRSSRLNSEGQVAGQVQLSNYFVVSVNGDEGNDSATEQTRLYDDIDYAINYNDQTQSADGLLELTSTVSGMYSPTDDETTNYLIFSGQMTLVPNQQQSGVLGYNDGVQFLVPNPNITFSTLATKLAGNSTAALPIEKDKTYYAQQFYTARTPDSPTAANSELMIYPLSDDAVTKFNYQYSGFHDEEDKIAKLPIFECELTIGDRYLVETYEDGNMQRPVYHWYTLSECPMVDGVKKHTFTLGIDPQIDDPIIGKEYQLSDTGFMYLNERGTVIPIHKSDALSGQVHFKILSVINQTWQQITRRHKTWFRRERWYADEKLLLSYISSIWLRNFNIKIASDNAQKMVDTTNKQDILYISNMAQQDFVSEQEEIEFKLTTALPTSELLQLGITQNHSLTNTVDMVNNQPLSEVTDVNTAETDRMERHYISQYYEMMCSPHVMVDTTLQYQGVMAQLRMLNFSEFTQMLPLKMTHDLRRETTHVTCIQKN